ncbi:MAG: hypothetical protein ACLQHF_05975 [Terracidiphilus sp.]
MKITRLFLGVVITLAFTFNLTAQQPSTGSSGFHSVACFKIKADSGAEFQKFETELLHKVAQGRVDDGELTALYVLRSVIPQGESAECDYLVVAIYPKLPHMFGHEQLQAAIKQAGLDITPEDYTNSRNAVSKLVSLAMFQNQALVGAPKKGDYFQVSYMKVAPGNMNDWIDYEKKVWKPLAEAMVKDGKQDAWSLNVQVMPFGTDTPYQGVTVDIYPSMDAVFADDAQFYDRFKRVHPDMELGTTIEHFERLRTQSMVHLYSLEDIIAAQ